MVVVVVFVGVLLCCIWLCCVGELPDVGVYVVGVNWNKLCWCIR